MKSIYITDLKAGDELANQPFLLQDVVRRTTRDGRAFLLGSLRDKTGAVACVYWDVPDYVESWVRPGLVVLVTGRIASYKDALQISITDMNTAFNPDMTAFLPSSQRPREEMIDELVDKIGRLSQPWQGLVEDLLLADTFLPRFANAPAARTMHHAYIGGLLEHTLSMATLAEHLAGHYPYVNKDLLLAGALLHDMGKALEYAIEESFSFSDDGRLVGHIVRAVTMIEAAADRLGTLSTDQRRQLVHLIASHHGTQEWGSPVVPKTLEAILLHQIDLLDSRVQGFFDHLNNDSGEDGWTVKASHMFNTELRRPPGFGEEE